MGDFVTAITIGRNAIDDFKYELIYADPPDKAHRELTALREAADQELKEYVLLRDKVDRQYEAAVEADGSDPDKMLEINRRFEPLRAMVKKQEDKYDQAFEKANSQSDR
jgi:hypothetical protein